MDKIRILIADDQQAGQEIIRKYIDSYFTMSNDIIEIATEGLAYKAIKKIEDGNSYDFIFSDLEFDTAHDNKNNLTGKDILMAANKLNAGTRFFTISGKLGSSNIKFLEDDLQNVGISFTSILKDEPIERVKNKIRNEHKLWTEYVLSVGISLSNKDEFLGCLRSHDLNRKINVFGYPKTLRYILSYWLTNISRVPTEIELLQEFPKSLYDLPRISSDKLFKRKGVKNQGLHNIDLLSSFYVNFWSNYSNNLPDILKKTKGYLNKLIEIYRDQDLKVYNSSLLENVEFDSQFKELKDEILYQGTKPKNQPFEKRRPKQINPQGALLDSNDEKDLVSFMNRLWIRLFCIGAYFYGVSELDIFKLIGTGTVPLPDESNFKIFTRSLWIDGFSMAMEPFARNYQSLWDSLCEYERNFLIEWWKDKIYNTENCSNSNLAHICKFVEETK